MLRNEQEAGEVEDDDLPLSRSLKKKPGKPKQQIDKDRVRDDDRIVSLLAAACEDDDEDAQPTTRRSTRPRKPTKRDDVPTPNKKRGRPPMKKDAVRSHAVDEDEEVIRLQLEIATLKATQADRLRREEEEEKRLRVREEQTAQLRREYEALKTKELEKQRKEKEERNLQRAKDERVAQLKAECDALRNAELAKLRKEEERRLRQVESDQEHARQLAREEIAKRKERLTMSDAKQREVVKKSKLTLRDTRRKIASFSSEEDEDVVEESGGMGKDAHLKDKTGELKSKKTPIVTKVKSSTKNMKEPAMSPKRRNMTNERMTRSTRPPLFKPGEYVGVHDDPVIIMCMALDADRQKRGLPLLYEGITRSQTLAPMERLPTLQGSLSHSVSTVRNSSGASSKSKSVSYADDVRGKEESDVCGEEDDEVEDSEGDDAWDDSEMDVTPASAMKKSRNAPLAAVKRLCQSAATTTDDDEEEDVTSNDQSDSERDALHKKIAALRKRAKDPPAAESQHSRTPAQSTSRVEVEATMRKNETKAQRN